MHSKHSPVNVRVLEPVSDFASSSITVLWLLRECIRMVFCHLIAQHLVVVFSPASLFSCLFFYIIAVFYLPKRKIMSRKSRRYAFLCSAAWETCHPCSRYMYARCDCHQKNYWLFLLQSCFVLTFLFCFLFWLLVMGKLNVRVTNTCVESVFGIACIECQT